MITTSKDYVDIRLTGEDVALIIRTDGTHELVIPGPKNNDELVPVSVLAIAFLGNKLHEETVAGIAAQFTSEMAAALHGKPPGETLQ